MTLCATVILVAPSASAEDTPKPDNEGSPVLTLSIRCDALVAKVGDEVLITFVIKNEGNADYQYPDRTYDRSGRLGEYELTAVDEEGKVVPDPRAKRRGGISGGVERQGRLAPGESFTKTIALNRWALLTKPGVYRVAGTYRTGGSRGEVRSPTLTLELKPRTDEEMAAHVQALTDQLATTRDGHTRAARVRKLMYTCDRRIVPALIETMYQSDPAQDDAGYWAGEALHYHLPDDQAVGDALWHAAANRGLAVGMFWTLKQRGFTREQIRPLIEVSLSPDHRVAWSEGALAAQEYADDRFTPRLIAIAKDPENTARVPAIYALALNRTDESVATLKALLVEPDPPNPMGRTIRQTTEDAIRSAYVYRGNAQGRLLRTDDFDLKYQRPN